MRDKLISVRLSSRELAQLAKVELPNKMSLSTWARITLLRVANQNEGTNG